MSRSSNVAKLSLALSVASLIVASVSLTLGRQINYLNYLPLFNALALLMLGLAIAALLLALFGIWRSRGRSIGVWLANGVAVFVLSLYAFD